MAKDGEHSRGWLAQACFLPWPHHITLLAPTLATSLHLLRRASYPGPITSPSLL